LYYFEKKTIELNAVRIGLLGIAVNFDEKFRLEIIFLEKILYIRYTS
jgi:hypothetical protein